MLHDLLPAVLHLQLVSVEYDDTGNYFLQETRLSLKKDIWMKVELTGKQLL